MEGRKKEEGRGGRGRGYLKAWAYSALLREKEARFFVWLVLVFGASPFSPLFSPITKGTETDGPDSGHGGEKEVKEKFWPLGQNRRENRKRKRRSTWGPHLHTPTPLKIVQIGV